MSLKGIMNMIPFKLYSSNKVMSFKLSSKKVYIQIF